MKTFLGLTLSGILKKIPLVIYRIISIFILEFGGLSRKLGFSNNVLTTIYLAAILILMLGFSYAAIPLYQIYCQASGSGGGVPKFSTEDASGTLPRDIGNMQENIADEIQKDVLIYFNADTSENPP